MSDSSAPRWLSRRWFAGRARRGNLLGFRLLLHVDLGAPHGIPNVLDPLLGALANHQFLPDLGVFLHYRLLSGFAHLDRVLLHQTFRRSGRWGLTNRAALDIHVLLT